MRSIATYPLAALCGLVIIGSLFLKWVKLPAAFLAPFAGAVASVEGDVTALEGGAEALVPQLQTSFGPRDLMDMGLTLETLFQDPVGIAIAASFLLAAAVAILGFLGGMVPRIFAILAGLLPFGIVGYLYFRAGDELSQFGVIELPDLTGEGGIMDAVNAVTPFVDMGLYAYFGGAAVLLLLGLLSPGKKEAY